MLSTPHKRFVWAKSDRLADFGFFRTLLMRRRPPPRSRKPFVKSRAGTGKWKPAPWTPWLWIK